MIDDTIKKLQDLSAKVENGQEDLVTEDDIRTLMNSLSEILTPMDRLSSNRWKNLSDNLIRFTTDVFKMGDGKIARRRSIPAVRIDREKFTDTLKLMHKMGILKEIIINSDWIDSAVLAEDDDALRIHSWAYDNHDESLDVIIDTYFELLLKGIRDYNVTINNDLEELIVARYRDATDEVGIDTNEIREYIINSVASEKEPLEPSLAMFQFARRPNEEENTQKGRGIRRLAESGETIRAYGAPNIQQNNGLHLPDSGLWLTEPAVFLDLPTAMDITAEELKVSVVCGQLFGQSQGMNRFLYQMPSTEAVSNPKNLRVYVRTCPASPRPGVLPNMLAHDAVELERCVKELASAMLDPSHPDHDPEGSLCLMRYIEAPISAVHVKGHEYFVVAFGPAGVTAAEGSHLAIKIQTDLAIEIERAVDYLSLDDDMVNHEIEFVWPSIKTPANNSSNTLMMTRNYMSEASYIHKTLPIITQVRGLLADKDPIKPPSLFQHPDTGEQMSTIYRGNVPKGFVEQLVIEDVGAGCLSDCAKLEQMVKDDEIPEGLVVYCPTGSTNCHAAGVCSEAKIPIIYAPIHDNGICWTEIDSWVTDVVGVKPQPYDSNQFMEYFLLGCREGDRYWDYGYAPMSQYFHTFLNGPINDPRLEGFYAGMYSTWLVKSALAVALGESRHYYTSCGRNRQPKNLVALFAIFRHLGVENLDNFEWSNRSSYYELLKRNEIGIESMLDILTLLRGVFDVDTSKWGSSYGGDKYAQSVQKALDVCHLLDEAIKSHEENGDFDLTVLLNVVNVLEHATHNNANFFDKFVGSTTFFDIGTHDHRYLHYLQQQFFVCIHWHTHFYQLIGEGWRISDNAKALYEEIEYVECTKRGYNDAPSNAYIIAASEREEDGNDVLKRVINTVRYQDQEHVNDWDGNDRFRVNISDALWGDNPSVKEWYLEAIRIAQESGYEYSHHMHFICDLECCHLSACQEHIELQKLDGREDLLPVITKLWDFMTKDSNNVPIYHTKCFLNSLAIQSSLSEKSEYSAKNMSDEKMIDELGWMLYQPESDGSKPQPSDNVYCEPNRLHSIEEEDTIDWQVERTIHEVPILSLPQMTKKKAAFFGHMFTALYRTVILPIKTEFRDIHCKNNFTLLRLILDSVDYLSHYNKKYVDGLEISNDDYTWFHLMEEKDLDMFREKYENFPYNETHQMFQLKIITSIADFMADYKDVTFLDVITNNQLYVFQDSELPTTRNFILMHNLLLREVLRDILPPEEEHRAMRVYPHRMSLIGLFQTLQNVLSEKEYDDLIKELIE